MSDEVYYCEVCGGAPHTVVRLPVKGKPWERAPYALDCPSDRPLLAHRLRTRDQAQHVAVRIFGPVMTTASTTKIKVSP